MGEFKGTVESMELKDKKIVFCFPYRGAGGVNSMFMRLALYLYSNNYAVALVDYTDGDMAINKKQDIELIPYYDDKEVFIPKDSIVVFQSMTPWSIYPSLKIHESTNIFFITTLAANFYTVLPGPLRNIMYEGEIVAKFFWNTILQSEYKKSKIFLELIEAKKSHAVLDSDIVCNLQKSMNIKLFQPRILPLFSLDVEKNLFLEQSKKEKNILTIGWVGRIADFKITMLNRTMRDTFDYANKIKKEINFIVVGNGEYEEKLFDKTSKYFKITRVAHIKPSELDNFMLQLDILFAMGTTALDGAKLGIPTVRLDYSYMTIPKDYKYKFFHEVKGYSMGERIESSCFENGNHTFEELLTIYESENKILSINCFEFYKANHSINKSFELLLSYIKDSSLVYEDILKRKLNKSLLYTLMKLIK
jgi:hypothetical protein